MQALLPQPLERIDRIHVRHGQARLIYFAGCDYFRMASHSRVVSALRRAALQHGLNVAASRVTTGHHELYDRLEEELAQFFGVEAAILVPNGYSGNLAVAQAHAGLFSVAWIDEKAHSSLWDATRFLDCPVISFRHRDPADLSRQVRHQRRPGQAILLTDGLFSHNGALAPLQMYRQTLGPSAVLLVDDAHGAGMLGDLGRGTIEHDGLNRRGVLQTITLSKAFGVSGGAIVGAASLRHRIIRRSGLFAGSTPLPLPLVEAARESLRILRRAGPMRQHLAREVAYAKAALSEAGLQVPEGPGPILAFRPRRAGQAELLRRKLLAAGIHPPWIRYGSGPSQGYFRFALSSAHAHKQVEKLVAVLVRFRDQLLSVS